MDLDQQKQLYEEAERIGCCKRCVLRYLGEKDGFKSLEDPDILLAALGLGITTDKREIKKFKPDPCVVCLDMLSDEFLSYASTHWKLSHIKKRYSHKDYMLIMHVPMCCELREHSVQLYLQKTFPNFQRENVTSIHQACRLSIEIPMNELLEKQNYGHASLTISCNTHYSADLEESLIILPLLKGQHLSKHVVKQMLSTVESATFMQYVNWPPTKPTAAIQLVDVSCSSKTICLQGNYCKYVRTLHQRKRMIGGDKNIVTGTFSVQSIIEDMTKKVFRFSNKVEAVFSNPEEHTVRVLGTGRTFKVDIKEPPFETIPDEKLRQIEAEIWKWKIIRVHNLHVVDKRIAFQSLEAERLGPVSCKLVCILPNCEDSTWYVKKLNLMKEINVCQKMPIRVLLSSKMQTRVKRITSIKAEPVPGRNNLIVIDMFAEGGLSLEEFVCGEFQRTNPSLKSLLQCDIHLLATDILGFGANQLIV